MKSGPFVKGLSAAVIRRYPEGVAPDHWEFAMSATIKALGLYRLGPAERILLAGELWDSVASSPEIWTEAASRGLFGYDWRPSAGTYVSEQPYELIAAPVNPITISDLPIGVRNWVSPIRFDTDFGLAGGLVAERQFREFNL